MRWKQYIEPANGTVRYTKKFAILPKNVEFETIMFHSYWIKEEFWYDGFKGYGSWKIVDTKLQYENKKIFTIVEGYRKELSPWEIDEMNNPKPNRVGGRYI